MNLEDVHLLINIFTLNVFYINFKLLFILNIPLVNHQEYELYHVLPMPVPHSFKDLTYALVQPTKRYFGITTNKHSYIQFNDIDTCKKISSEHYICENVNEYSAVSNPCCESLMMTQVLKALPKECISKFMYGDVEIWQKLTNNRWIYIYSNPTKITIDCLNNNIQEYELRNTGIIELDKNCKGYANLIQITAKSDIITNFTSPSFDLDLTKDDCCNDFKLKQTEHIFISAKIGNIQLDDLNLASVKLHSIEEAINEQQARKLTHRHNVHMSYLIYLLCAIVLAYFIFRFC